MKKIVGALVVSAVIAFLLFCRIIYLTMLSVLLALNPSVSRYTPKRRLIITDILNTNKLGQLKRNIAIRVFYLGLWLNAEP